jgi:hypothetical protein
LSGSRLTVAFNQVRKDCAFISRIGMNTNENNAIRSKNLRMLKTKYFCSLRSAFSPRVIKGILSVEYMNEIRTPRGGKKMMVQGMLGAIFLKVLELEMLCLTLLWKLLLMAEDKVEWCLQG